MTNKQYNALGALSNAISDIEWMSAASDFAPASNGKPAGQAHIGWIKVCNRLKRYQKALEEAVQEG